jgi:hypothetical protein
MSLSDPRNIFGVHSVTPYSRTDATFYGTAKVIGSFDASFTGDLIELNGGSSQYPYGVESGLIKADLKVQFKEYADWMFTLFLGKAPTATGVDTAGTVSTLTNKKGTSVASATTGIASVTVTPTTGKNDLKFTKYVVVAVGADTVDVYAASDADFGRGTAGSYLTDALKIAAAVSIEDTGATTALAGYGLTLTSGSGTVALTTGDTATFEVKPPSTKSMTVRIGGASSSFPEFGCIAMAQKRGNGELVELDIFKCKGIGLPFGFKEKAWSEAPVTAKALFDSAKDGVYDFRTVTES